MPKPDVWVIGETNAVSLRYPILADERCRAIAAFKGILILRDAMSSAPITRDQQQARLTHQNLVSVGNRPRQYLL